MRMLAPPALMFFCNSILFISLFTRLPDIQAGLGIDKAMLGAALLAVPLGTFLALPLAGKINNALSPRRTAALMLALLALLIPVLALVPFYAVVLGLVLMGFIRTILEVAQNMVSTGIEQQSGVKILARSHGFWSIGLLVGTIASGLLAGWGTSAAVHLAGAGAFVLLCCLLILRITPPAVAPWIAQSGAKATIFVMPDKAILLIALLIIGIGIIEGAIYDWGIFFIQEEITGDPARAGLLYACFTVGMGFTRLIGDRLRDTFRPQHLVQGSALLVALGLILLLLVGGQLAGGLGLALIGCGVALNYPMAVATVANLGGQRSPAENLAALSLTMLVSTLGIPPVLGAIAEHFGITASFLILLPLTVLSVIMAPVAEGRRPLLTRRSRQGTTPAK
ncbi:MFS transporter [Rhizobium sp. CG5]|uniref:MFS transporter n=1 Tax=Rhizobium sp. CG5 TaxID=2726076 RepID=UPI00203380C9|nr:MFS transporter [Rhizobium sp. CG5]MCM2474722.1 MFS transporter [Rhizobium sp. CG5]